MNDHEVEVLADSPQLSEFTGEWSGTWLTGNNGDAKMVTLATPMNTGNQFVENAINLPARVCIFDQQYF